MQAVFSDDTIVSMATGQGATETEHAGQMRAEPVFHIDVDSTQHKVSTFVNGEPHTAEAEDDQVDELAPVWMSIADAGTTFAWAPPEAATWPTARRDAWEKLNSEPEAYYMHYLAPNERAVTGEWKNDELDRLKHLVCEHREKMHHGAWGFLSMHIRGRTGEQCKAQYEQMLREQQRDEHVQSTPQCAKSMRAGWATKRDEAKVVADGTAGDGRGDSREGSGTKLRCKTQAVGGVTRPTEEATAESPMVAATLTYTDSPPATANDTNASDANADGADGADSPIGSFAALSLVSSTSANDGAGAQRSERAMETAATTETAKATAATATAAMATEDAHGTTSERNETKLKPDGTSTSKSAAPVRHVADFNSVTDSGVNSATTFAVNVASKRSSEAPADGARASKHARASEAATPPTSTAAATTTTTATTARAMPATTSSTTSSTTSAPPARTSSAQSRGSSSAPSASPMPRRPPSAPSAPSTVNASSRPPLRLIGHENDFADSAAKRQRAEAFAAQQHALRLAHQSNNAAGPRDQNHHQHSATHGSSASSLSRRESTSATATPSTHSSSDARPAAHPTPNASSSASTPRRSSQPTQPSRHSSQLSASRSAKPHAAANSMRPPAPRKASHGANAAHSPLASTSHSARSSSAVARRAKPSILVPTNVSRTTAPNSSRTTASSSSRTTAPSLSRTIGPSPPKRQATDRVPSRPQMCWLLSRLLEKTNRSEDDSDDPDEQNIAPNDNANAALTVNPLSTTTTATIATSSATTTAAASSLSVVGDVSTPNAARVLSPRASAHNVHAASLAARSPPSASPRRRLSAQDALAAQAELLSELRTRRRWICHLYETELAEAADADADDAMHARAHATTDGSTAVAAAPSPLSRVSAVERKFAPLFSDLALQERLQSDSLEAMRAWEAAGRPPRPLGAPAFTLYRGAAAKPQWQLLEDDAEMTPSSV